MTGRPPFHGIRGVHAVADAHRALPVGPFQPLLSVPAGLETWLRRLLEKDPRSRFTRAADAAWAVRALRHAPLRDRLSWAGRQEAPVDPDTTLTHADLGLPGADDGATLAFTLGFAPPQPAGATPAARETLRPSTEAPPFPRGWHHPVPPAPPPRLLGVGLGLYGLRPVRLVDRVALRDRLWSALGSVHATGRPRAVVLHGPSGTGKSRLADWLCQRAREVGAADVLRAVYDRVEGQPQGVAGLLARWSTGAGLDHSALAERIARLIDLPTDAGWEQSQVLAELVLGTGRVQFTSEAERHVAMVRLLHHLAADRPLVLWLDDVQWGPEGVELANEVLRADTLGQLPALVVLTTRPEGLSQPGLVELLERVEAEPLEVGPLAPADQQALLGDLLGLDNHLARRVAQRTGGNPLFAVQLVGGWVQRGLLEVGQRGFELQEEEAFDLPEDLRDVWRARLDRVLLGRSEEDQVAVEVAAVLGRRFQPAEWLDVCASRGCPPSPTLLDHLLAARLVIAEEGTCSWVHDQLREAIEDRSTEAGRTAGHHRVCATTLEQRYGLRAQPRVGWHRVQAGDLEASLTPLLESARRLARGRRLAAAEGLLGLRERALQQAAVPPGDPRWGEGWVAWAELRHFQGALDASERWAHRVLRAGEHHPWEALVARACFHLGCVHHRRGAADEARANHERAEAVLLRLGLAEYTGQVRWELAYLDAQQGHLDRAERGFRVARQRSLAVDNRRDAASCMRGLGMVARQQGQMDRAVGYLVQARAEFEAIGGMFGLGCCDNDLADVARERGEREEAATLYGKALTRFEALGSSEVTIVRLNLAILETRQGHWEAAQTLLERVRGDCKRQGSAWLEGTACLLMLPALASQCDWPAWDLAWADAQELLLATGFFELDLARVAALAAALATDASHPERATPLREVAVRWLDALGHTDEARAVQREHWTWGSSA